ncbi:MAG: YdeI/OmpD-associated family protein [Mycobacteriales bacterium]
MDTITFHATLELHGKTATGIAVPEDVVTALGGGRRPAVAATVNGHTYRTTVTPMGGRFMLPVSGDRRAAAGVAAGDDVEVTLALDTAPREVTVPDDLTAALAAADDAARRFFDGLSYSHRLTYVTWIESAKKAETRQRRVAQAVEMLREGRTRS